jgi:hypothetical protein
MEAEAGWRWSVEGEGAGPVEIERYAPASWSCLLRSVKPAHMVRSAVLSYLARRGPLGR